MTLTGKDIAATFPIPLNEKIPKSAIRKALPQILAVMVKNVLLVAYGMTLGYPTILIPGLSGQDPDEPIRLNQEQISWISSINMMCVPLGCLLSGVVTQPIGRKRSMQFGNIPLLLCWVIFKFSNAVWQVYFALALTGLAGGLLEAPVLTYVAEITQPHLRGMLSATSTLSVILGILLQFLLGTFLNWRSVAVASCSLPILSFVLLFFVPESPHWLIMKNKPEKARKSLAWLRGWATLEEIEPEFQEISKKEGSDVIGLDNLAFECNGNNEGNAKVQTTKVKSATSMRSTFGDPKNYVNKAFICPLSLIGFIFFLCHFTGMTTLQTYAVQIFANLQAPIDKYYATVLLGVSEFLGSLTCVILIHYTGKRILTFVSLIVSAICFITVGTYAHMIDVTYFTSQNATFPIEENIDVGAYKWIPLTFLVLAAFVIHCGLRVLPWILIGEVFARETRAIGSGVSGAIAYVFGFTTNKIFLQMVGTMTLPGTYWFYGSTSVVGLIILYYWLPETEGKTLQQITDHFAGISKLGNKVQRKTKKEPLGRDNAAFEDKVPQVTSIYRSESQL